jgi:hypothetical protein
VKLFRGSVVLAVTLGYLSIAFRLFGAFWTTGLGDWYDPYFINYLLEHWYLSAARLTDPTSPPMFFPAAGTLGYSHGLILYVPFYAATRWFLHPFQAYNTSLLSVMATGVVCLYAMFRRLLRLTFAESLLLSAFFLASPNVMSGPIGVWSQRASVFLVPTILLAALASRSMRPGRRRILSAVGVGLLSTRSMQDFYTAHLSSVCRPRRPAWLVLARASSALLSSDVSALRFVIIATGNVDALLIVTGGGSIDIFEDRVLA